MVHLEITHKLVLHSLFAVALAGAVACGTAAAHTEHSMTAPEELTWKDVPSVGPGAKIAVIEGPLDKPVPFTFRLRMPANFKVAPHIHPAFERVTVLSGTFHFAHGENYDEARTRPLVPGSVAIMPPGAPMFGFTREETVIQLHGVGPWGITYLNPADDPRKR
jgi:quercetin dioxygenase-like cupin family protein